MPLFLVVFVLLGGLPAVAGTHDASQRGSHQAVVCASVPGGPVWSDALEGTDPIRPVPSTFVVTRTAARVTPTPAARMLAAAPTRPVHRRALLRMPATDDDPPQSAS